MAIRGWLYRLTYCESTRAVLPFHVHVAATTDIGGVHVCRVK